jgi:hypothetical protein
MIMNWCAPAGNYEALVLAGDLLAFVIISNRQTNYTCSLPQQQACHAAQRAQLLLVNAQANHAPRQICHRVVHNMATRGKTHAPVAYTSFSSPFWKHRSTRLFQAGRQPAWCEAMPRNSAGTSLSRTASGLSALQKRQHIKTKGYAAAARLLSVSHVTMQALACHAQHQVVNTAAQQKRVWQQRQQNCGQPAWWGVMPRNSAGTSLSRTASGLSALQHNKNAAAAARLWGCMPHRSTEMCKDQAACNDLLMDALSLVSAVCCCLCQISLSLAARANGRDHLHKFIECMPS